MKINLTVCFIFLFICADQMARQDLQSVSALIYTVSVKMHRMFYSRKDGGTEIVIHSRDAIMMTKWCLALCRWTLG